MVLNYTGEGRFSFVLVDPRGRHRDGGLYGDDLGDIMSSATRSLGPDLPIAILFEADFTSQNGLYPGWREIDRLEFEP